MKKNEFFCFLSFIFALFLNSFRIYFAEIHLTIVRSSRQCYRLCPHIKLRTNVKGVIQILRNHVGGGGGGKPPKS